MKNSRKLDYSVDFTSNLTSPTESTGVVTPSLQLKQSIETLNIQKIQNETNQQAIQVRVTMHPDLGEAIENLGIVNSNLLS